MTEGWGMVAAAAIALMGVFSGLFIGRRQVRDQAQVEHGQWLRGQRQEAYVNLIAAWDEAVPRFWDEILEHEQIYHIDQDDAWDEARVGAQATMDSARAPLRRAAERVQMLGPDEVDEAVHQMLVTVQKMCNAIDSQYSSAVSHPEAFAGFERALQETADRRKAFLAASRSALRQTPDTGRS
ncbi:hypothetical protein OG311_37960 (plasmid) [Streptomyces sp. NBC_01343]|uniref:hypothetical protein n=1 Tax=Streptomyces sp. NBC_01343 TaxID=2903832 RepID=UPI002E1399D3|nr:hypothetical protein OG311_37960 [Streptomyces sp. NBC_01343]